MTDDRILALERELAKLRAEVADVRQAIKEESDNTTRHIISINKGMGLTSDWMTTLIYKVMPEYATARKQLNGIFGLDSPPPSHEKSN